MENGPLHDDKLFRAVHDRLSDYEVPYDGADWDAMGRSLDQLPKTKRLNRFQWRISLNTILVAVGVTGLSILGYALASNSGNAAPVEAMGQPAAMKTDPPKMQNTSMTIPVTAQPVTASDPAPQNTALQPQDESATTVSIAQPQKIRKKKSDSELLFGDMIDRRKGFIYKTQEDQKILESYKPSAPDTYYDMDQGKVKEIKVHRDSTGTKAERRPVTADSTATNSPHPSAPTGSEREGFDNF